MPITLSELHDALMEMPRGKAPGIDGLPPELYVAFWDILGPPLFENITAAVKVESFTRQSNTALISLLLKKDKDPSDCASYRPLSLLNTDIKIFAKILACRLRNCMTLLCHCDQTGFIRTRIASDNTRRLLHLINYASGIDSPAAVLSLDALKAFDRLEWPYLWYTLRRLGFGDSYIKWIKVLYADPVAQVMSGRQVSQPFPVSRGSRQGCPLSPLLFALSLEPLAQSIRQSQNFSPIRVNGTDHRISLYADDVLMFVEHAPQSIPVILDTFNKFSDISGYKINWTKSALFPLNDVLKPAMIPTTIPIVKHFKYLGISTCRSVSRIAKINFGRITREVMTDMDRWRHLPMSLRARISAVIMNILPRVNFVSSMIPLPPPPKTWKKLQSAMSKFMWGGSPT